MLSAVRSPFRTALVFLSCAYGGILFQQPTLCALCNDVGRKNAGAVFGFMNTAANVASALSALVFGYLVGYFENYNTPFIPMVALLSLGALLWLQADPTRELFPEEQPDAILGGRGRHVVSYSFDPDLAVFRHPVVRSRP